jgi:uroporphyrinogen-III synthase
MRVLVTRPAEDAAVTADAVRARGHEPVIAPLSVICHETPAPPPEMPAATIFTSRNAVRALSGVDWARDLHALPAYCVGAATAHAAREAGFTHVIGGGGTGALLAEHIAYAHKAGSGALLYFTGDHLAFDMQSALEACNLSVWRRVVYRSALVPALPADVVEQLHDGSLDAVMLMSPRTAGHFAQLAQEAGVARAAARLTCFCLSEPVAHALSPLSAADIRVAAKPTHEALIDMLGPSSAA